MPSQTILITGAGGYVASHVVLELLATNHHVVGIDNFSNCVKGESGMPVSLERVKDLVGGNLTFHECDLLDEEALPPILAQAKVDCCIHFAGLKAVGESVEKPLEYYWNNVVGSLNLLKALRIANVKRFIFSSSATVYGKPTSLPITEEHTVGVELTNPYGKSKYFIEEILRDLYASDETWNIRILRYFNPVGAHPSGMIGEDPNGLPNNLMPNIVLAASGRIQSLMVFGKDYATVDGTGVRDYIHVVDLARGHLAALEHLNCQPCLDIFNLGTGTGYSVLEMVRAFEKASGVTVPYTFEARRQGDLDTVFCDTAKAQRVLDWSAQLDLPTMCQDTWNWHLKNPTGYK